MSEIMSRSVLMPNMVFTPHNFNEIAKEFKAKYKEENGETFKGNVYFAMTIGVINTKKIPDIEDCLLLIRGGNNLCDIKTAEDKYTSFVKAYPERGTIGCFCDMCRLLNQDLPFANQFGDMLEGLEVSIKEYIDSIKKRKEIQKIFHKAWSSANINDIKNGKVNINDILNNIAPNKEEVTDNKEEITNKEVTEEPEVEPKVTK